MEKKRILIEVEVDEEQKDSIMKSMYTGTPLASDIKVLSIFIDDYKFSDLIEDFRANINQKLDELKKEY